MLRTVTRRVTKTESSVAPPRSLWWANSSVAGRFFKKCPFHRAFPIPRRGYGTDWRKRLLTGDKNLYIFLADAGVLAIVYVGE